MGGKNGISSSLRINLTIDAYLIKVVLKTTLIMGRFNEKHYNN
jgi:hypothetical protein